MAFSFLPAAPHVAPPVQHNSRSQNQRDPHRCAGTTAETNCIPHHDFVHFHPTLFFPLSLFFCSAPTIDCRLLVVCSTSCCGLVIGFMVAQIRNQIASFEQKLREAEHKLRLREKEIVDIQVRRPSLSLLLFCRIVLHVPIPPTS